LEAGAELIAGESISIYGDYEDADPGLPAHIVIEGSMTAPEIVIYGGGEDDVIDINPETLDGHTTVLGGDGVDTITVDTLQSLDIDRRGEADRYTLDLDGQGGSDVYLVNISGG